MTISIKTLSLPELTRLISAAEKRLEALARRRPASAVRRELAALAASQGYSLDQLINVREEAPARKRAPKRKASKVAPKYRDPDNKANTWSGRGRMPRWLAAKVRAGHDAMDFLIPGLARPTSKKSSAVGRRSVFKVRSS